MSKYCNWTMSKECMKDIFNLSMQQNGSQVRIFTVLNHVSSSGMTRYISAFVPISYPNKDGSYRADIICIAREKRMSGCGMDMGFHLAYSLFSEVYGGNPNFPYQKCLSHSWL